MTKVIIDSFDTEEQAVAFVDWLKNSFDRQVPRLLTTEGPQVIDWDGIDTDSSNKCQIVVNITVSDLEDEF